MTFTYENMHTYEYHILHEFIMLEKSLSTGFNIVEHLTKVVEKLLRAGFNIVEHISNVEDTNI